MPVEDKNDKAESGDAENSVSDKVNVTLPGTVEKIIPAVGNEPEKAQITLEGADDLYREVRMEDTLQGADGKPVALKKGTEVDVTIEADQSDTKPKE